MLNSRFAGIPISSSTIDGPGVPQLMNRGEQTLRAVTGSGGRLHFGMVAGIKSERWPTSNRNPWPDCLGIRSDYYFRQLRDGKISAIPEDWDLTTLKEFGKLCAWALARAHARSGDPARIAGYMGSNTTFDDAVCEFAVEYADQNLRDYRGFVKGIREGRIPVASED